MRALHNSVLRWISLALVFVFLFTSMPAAMAEGMMGENRPSQIGDVMPGVTVGDEEEPLPFNTPEPSVEPSQEPAVSPSHEPPAVTNTPQETDDDITTDEPPMAGHDDYSPLHPSQTPSPSHALPPDVSASPTLPDPSPEVDPASVAQGGVPLPSGGVTLLPPPGPTIIPLEPDVLEGWTVNVEIRVLDADGLPYTGELKSMFELRFVDPSDVAYHVVAGLDGCRMLGLDTELYRVESVYVPIGYKLVSIEEQPDEYLLPLIEDTTICVTYRKVPAFTSLSAYIALIG